MTNLFFFILSLSCSGLLLGLLVLVISRLLGNRVSYTWRYYIWLPVLLRLLVPFAPDVTLLGPAYDQFFNQIDVISDQYVRNSGPSAQGTTGLTISNPPEQQPTLPTDKKPLKPAAVTTNSHLDIPALIARLWLFPAIGMLLLKWLQYLAFCKKIRNKARPAKQPEVQNALADAAAQLKLHRTITVWYCDLVDAPGMIGLFRPKLLLPGPYPADQLPYIFRHELTHLKRQDLIYKWLLQITVCIHWFNPFVYWLRREIDRLCELSCDEQVTVSFDRPQRLCYGRILLESVPLNTAGGKTQFITSLNHQKGELKERLQVIKKERRTSLRMRLLAGFLVIPILIIMVFSGTKYITPAQLSANATGLFRRVGAQMDPLELLSAFPEAENYRTEGYSLDLRTKDLSALDLRDYEDQLLYSIYDTNTRWPGQLPDGFSPDAILARSKNPGLGIADLHALGLTGDQVSIGIIDQVLFTGHDEYRDVLKHYEEIPKMNQPPSMSGPSMASTISGKTTGIAPGASLYYIGSTLLKGDFTEAEYRQLPETETITFQYFAESLNRLLEINQTLPDQKKIKVIAIGRGFSPGYEGYEEMMSAIEKAHEQGIFVVTTSLQKEYGFPIAGLDRDPLGDPDNLNSYSVGTWEKEFAGSFQDCLFFPMDGRTYASSSDKNAYEWGRIGGFSDVVSYITGLYALALEQYPDLTPQEFWTAATETANSLTVDNLGEPYTISQIINPPGLIEALK